MTSNWQQQISDLGTDAGISLGGAQQLIDTLAAALRELSSRQPRSDTVVPLFSGRPGEDVEIFIARLQQYADENRLDPQSTTIYGATFFRGEAAKWWDKYAHRSFPAARFFEWLRDEYGSSDTTTGYQMVWATVNPPTTRQTTDDCGDEGTVPIPSRPVEEIRPQGEEEPAKQERPSGEQPRPLVSGPPSPRGTASRTTRSKATRPKGPGRQIPPQPAESKQTTDDCGDKGTVPIPAQPVEEIRPQREEGSEKQERPSGEQPRPLAPDPMPRPNPANSTPPSPRGTALTTHFRATTEGPDKPAAPTTKATPPATASPGKKPDRMLYGTFGFPLVIGVSYPSQRGKGPRQQGRSPLKLASGQPPAPITREISDSVCTAKVTQTRHAVTFFGQFARLLYGSEHLIWCSG